MVVVARAVKFAACFLCYFSVNILVQGFFKGDSMPNVANCKKCGTLFLQTSKRDICDKCFEEQNKLVNEINSYVINAIEPTVFLDDLLKKFDMKIDEFESLYLAGKFVKISQKVTMKCAKCGNIVPIANKTNMLCSSCAKKLQNEI